jgi:hypothetical protein
MLRGAALGGIVATTPQHCWLCLQSADVLLIKHIFRLHACLTPAGRRFVEERMEAKREAKRRMAESRARINRAKKEAADAAKAAAKEARAAAKKGAGAGGGSAAAGGGSGAAGGKGEAAAAGEDRMMQGSAAVGGVLQHVSVRHCLAADTCMLAEAVCINASSKQWLAPCMHAPSVLTSLAAASCLLLQRSPPVQQQARQPAAQQAAQRAKAARKLPSQQQQQQVARPHVRRALQRSHLMKRLNCAALQCSSSSWSLLQRGGCA